MNSPGLGAVALGHAGFGVGAGSNVFPNRSVMADAARLSLGGEEDMQIRE